jgi:putative aminopeptidase
MARGSSLVLLLLTLGAAPAASSLPMAPTSDPDSSLVPRGLPIETDAFGNEIVRFGSGRPLTLVAVRRDVPAYFVTSITPDGYLRVQNQGSSPSLLWDQFQIGRRVFVTTKDGRVLPGVVAAPNTHFRRGDDIPIPEATVDDIFVDVGAETDKQAREMGFENLCVVSQVGEISRPRASISNERWVGPGAPLALGCNVATALSYDAMPLSEVTDIPASMPHTAGDLLPKERIPLILAWIAQGSVGGRGAETLARQWKPDRVVVIAPFVPSPGDTGAAPWGLIVTPIGAKADSLKAWAEEVGRKIDGRVRTARPDPVSTAFDRLGTPVVQIGIPSVYPGSPGELTPNLQLMSIVSRLGENVPAWNAPEPPARLQSLSHWPPPTSDSVTHRGTWSVLAPLVHAQGISEHEEAVRDTVLSLIPKSFKTVTDPHGNVIVRWGSGKPRCAFMAHMDEIGYRVTGIDADGRLRVEKKGGFYDWLYEGETVRRGDGRLAVVAPRSDYLVRPRPTIDQPLSDHHRVAPAGYKGLPDSLVRVDPGNFNADESKDWMGAQITVVKNLARLGEHRVAGRSLDDRFGCTALILAIRQLSHERVPKDGCVLFAFTVEEETGLVGATKLSDDLLAAGELPPIVHAVDTFVSSDTPLEDDRYAHAVLGKGCVIRAVDTGSAAPKVAVDAVRRLAAQHFIPLQFGVTSGGNDGQPFAARGSVNVPLGWPLRYSHTQVETADLRDLEALARLVTELARTRPGTE